MLRQYHIHRRITIRREIQSPREILHHTSNSSISARTEACMKKSLNSNPKFSLSSFDHSTTLRISKTRSDFFEFYRKNKYTWKRRSVSSDYRRNLSKLGGKRPEFDGIGVYMEEIDEVLEFQSEKKGFSY